MIPIVANVLTVVAWPSLAMRPASVAELVLALAALAQVTPVVNGSGRSRRTSGVHRSNRAYGLQLERIARDMQNGTALHADVLRAAERELRVALRAGSRRPLLRALRLQRREHEIVIELQRLHGQRPLDLELVEQLDDLRARVLAQAADESS